MKIKTAGRQSFLCSAPLLAALISILLPDRFVAQDLETVSPPQPGEFRFLVRGDEGLSIRVQRSANLRDWDDWQALTLGATPSELSDLDAGDNPHRFYRAVTP